MPKPPPGIAEGDFQTALRELEAVVGRDWLFKSEEDVALYKDGYSPLWGEPEERVASAAVAPNSVEQIQAIVKIANQRGLPLYPISTGRNLTYGGSAPTYSGSVVVRLPGCRKLHRLYGSPLPRPDRPQMLSNVTADITLVDGVNGVWMS